MDKEEFVQATAITITFWFAVSLISPILSPYIQSLGFTDMQISWIFSIFPLVIILASPLIGKLSDKYGRTLIIILGVAFEICALVLYIYSYNAVILILARAMNALAMVAVSLIALSKIEDSLKDTDRGKFAGISLSLNSLGKLLSPFIGGLLADYLFIEMPFFMAIIILSSLLLAMIVKSKSINQKIFDVKYNLFKEIRSFMSNRQLKSVGIMGFIMHANTPAMLVFMPLFVISRFNLGYSFVGFIVFLTALPHLFQFYFGRLCDSFGRKIFIFLGTFIVGASWILVPLNHSALWISGVFLFMGIGGAIWNISAWSLMSDIGEKIKKEGTVVTTYFSFAKIGSFVSFIISGLIVQFFSIPVLFIIGGISTIAGSIFFLRTSRINSP